MTRNDQQPHTYPADKTRQGEIILDTRAKRVVFATALAIFILAIVATPFIIEAF